MTDAFKERLDTALASDSARSSQSAPTALSNGPARPLSTDDEVDVRPLGELRPLPPLPRRSVRVPTEGRPVYDPFTARRRQTPEWLVIYTATVVGGDIIAAAAAAGAVALMSPVSPLGLRLATVGALAWPLLLMSLGTYAER